MSTTHAAATRTNQATFIRFSLGRPAKAPAGASVQVHPSQRPARPANHSPASGLGWGLLVSL